MVELLISGKDIKDPNVKCINPFHKVYSQKRNLEVGCVGPDSSIMMDGDANLWFLGGKFEDYY